MPRNRPVVRHYGNEIVLSDIILTIYWESSDEFLNLFLYEWQKAFHVVPIFSSCMLPSKCITSYLTDSPINYYFAVWKLCQPQKLVF